MWDTARLCILRFCCWFQFNKCHILLPWSCVSFVPAHLSSQIRNSAEIPEVLPLSSHPTAQYLFLEFSTFPCPSHPARTAPKLPFHAPISCQGQNSGLFLCNYLILSLKELPESESIQWELTNPRLVTNPCTAGDVSTQPKPSSSRAGPTSSAPAQSFLQRIRICLLAQTKASRYQLCQQTSIKNLSELLQNTSAVSLSPSWARLPPWHSGAGEEFPAPSPTGESWASLMS